MNKEIRRAPRVVVCKECHGTGIQPAETPQRHPTICVQCEGSGRVTVSSVTMLDIRPYRPRITEPIKNM